MIWRSLFQLLAFVAAASANATWTVTEILQAGHIESYGHDADGDIQVGETHPVGWMHAGKWKRTTASFVDLHPAGATESAAFSVSGSLIGGRATIGGRWQAGYWTGSASTWKNVHPPGADWSSIYEVHDQVKAGWVSWAGSYHATMWVGPSNQLVSLHPQGAISSNIGDINANSQVGSVMFSGHERAYKWSGSAESGVDLNPAGARGSFATALGQDRIFGIALFDDPWYVAGYWTGSASTWTSMGPSGSTASSIGATVGDLAAGSVDFDQHQGLSNDHAYVWFLNGTGGEDLHEYLPSSYSSSSIRAASSDGVNYYMVGYGYDDVERRSKMLIWTRPVPEPSSLIALATALTVAASKKRPGLVHGS